MEYIPCDINGIIGCTAETPILEDEQDLVRTKCQEPLVILRHPSKDSPNLYLLEDARYYVELDCMGRELQKPLSILRDSNVGIEEVPARGHIYAIQFAGYVGRGTIDLTIDGQRVEYPFEVRSTKIEYIREYPRMISDISEFYTALMLHSNAPLSTRFDLGSGQSTSYYEDFILINYMFTKLGLEDAFGYICNNIHRELIYERTVSQDCSAYNVDPSSLQDMMSGSNISVRDGGSISGRYEFMTTINNDPIDTFDTPENRLIKDFLLVLLNILETIRTSNKEGYIRTTTDRMINDVNGMLSEWWMKEVGRLEHVPFDSNVLSSKYGYSNIFQMYLMLGLELDYRIHDAEYLFEGRTNRVSQTYEYWCYIQLFNALCSLSGRHREYVQQIQKGWELSIRGMEPIRFLIPGGSSDILVDLYYNKATSKKGDSLESYSVMLRPDFSLIIDNGIRKRVVNFDSKYKLQVENDESIEDDDPINTVCWRADIYKMHTYRDAIYNCWGSYVLYPGDRSEWYSKKYLCDVMEENDIPSVGAIPLAPGNEMNYDKLIETLSTIINLVIGVDERELMLDYAL